MSNPGDFAYTVKQQADIVRIVGDYVKLKKSGAQNFTGLCPFHSEKSPSFSVHATRQFYYCFGCGAKGDVFSFVQKLENSSFPEAVRTVATKLGIPLPKQNYSPAEAREAGMRTKLLELHESACKFFEQQLRTPAGAGAREYLASRGFTEDNIAKFRVGYAPDHGFAMRDALKNEADEATLKQSGLFGWKDESAGVSGLYAKFRNRLIFPIADEQGRVIAFGGRRLDAGVTDKDKLGPKYLNSPETPIYSKGRVLYNLDKAKEAIRKLDYSIVVEGYMDCISVYAAGFHNVIASSGTAFGEAQVKLLGRFSKKIVVNFDPDTAGAAATERSLAMLVEEDFDVKVVQLEAGLDPDLYVRNKGAQAYGQALKESPRYFEYLVRRAQAQFPGKTADSKVKALNYLLPHIQRVPNRIARDEMASEAAQKLGIDSAVLRQELKSAAGSRSQKMSAASQAEHPLSVAEKVLIRALLPGDAGVSADARSRALVVMQADAVHKEWPSEAIVEGLLAAQGPGAGEGFDPLEMQLDDWSRNQLATLLMQESGEEISEAEVEKALSALRRPQLERRLQQLQQQIDDAARKGDAGKLAEFQSEKMRLKRELDESKRVVAKL